MNPTIILLILNIGASLFAWNNQDVYRKWIMNPYKVNTDNQYFRFITSGFIHGDWMHLIFNMYGLLFVSIFLEPILGRAKFIIAYFSCGLLASLASIWWHPATLSVGASGAIFGLYGVLTALLTTNKADASSKRGLLINNAIFKF